MRRRAYLVNPMHDYPSYNTSEVLAARGYRAGSPTAELNLPTLSTMASKHLDVQICDEILTPVDFDTSAEIVGITGKQPLIDSRMRLKHWFIAEQNVQELELRHMAA